MNTLLYPNPDDTTWEGISAKPSSDRGFTAQNRIRMKHRRRSYNYEITSAKGRFVLRNPNGPFCRESLPYPYRAPRGCRRYPVRITLAPDALTESKRGTKGRRSFKAKIIACDHTAVIIDYCGEPRSGQWTHRRVQAGCRAVRDRLAKSRSARPLLFDELGRNSRCKPGRLDGRA